jgi:hypothetical protein
MSVYNCEHCDKWLDNDYFPAEFIEDSKGNEKPVCEDCFIEYIEDKEISNEQM